MEIIILITLIQFLKEKKFNPYYYRVAKFMGDKFQNRQYRNNTLFKSTLLSE